MKKITLLFFAVAVSFGLTVFTFAQKKTSVPPVYLNVTIDDGVSQSLYGIGSDGGGVYSHGTDSVEAQFLSTGVLDFKSSAGIRKINAFYSTSLGDSQTALTLPASETAASFQILTFVNTPPFQNMGIGETRCQGLGVNIFTSGNTRTIGYRAGRGTITNTGYVRAARLSNNEFNKRVWTLESYTGDVPCSTYDNIARIRDAKTSGKPVPDTDYGRYNMPLKLILTEK